LENKSEDSQSVLREKGGVESLAGGWSLPKGQKLQSRGGKIPKLDWGVIPMMQEIKQKFARPCGRKRN